MIDISHHHRIMRNVQHSPGQTANEWAYWNVCIANKPLYNTSYTNSDSLYASSMLCQGSFSSYSQMNSSRSVSKSENRKLSMYGKDNDAIHQEVLLNDTDVWTTEPFDTVFEDSLSNTTDKTLLGCADCLTWSRSNNYDEHQKYEQLDISRSTATKGYGRSK